MEQKLKKSKQRDAILAFLSTRKDHPTADTIYQNVRQTFPNISLGTVYRNLALLSDRGEILKLSYNGNSDRFDFTTAPHYHFCCNKCGAVSDLEMDSIDSIIEVAGKHFDGKITGYNAYFNGLCPICLAEQKA